MAILGSAVTALVSAVNPAAGLALSGARAALGWARRNWKAAAAIGATLALVLGFLVLRGEIRHRDKVIASQAALIAAVDKEVERGVGKPIPADDAPTYIRAFVDNLATVKAALDRQSAALEAAQQDANAHEAAAHQAAQPTQAQQQREKNRQAITQGTGALTPQDWGKL